MMAVMWDEVHPWPHGTGLYDAYVNSVRDSTIKFKDQIGPIVVHTPISV